MSTICRSRAMPKPQVSLHVLQIHDPCTPRDCHDEQGLARTGDLGATADDMMNQVSRHRHPKSAASSNPGCSHRRQLLAAVSVALGTSCSQRSLRSSYRVTVTKIHRLSER